MGENIHLVMDDNNDEKLVEHLPYYAKETNYEKLENKPQINNVELIGNKFLNDLFHDGIIIDGGEAVM